MRSISSRFMVIMLSVITLGMFLVTSIITYLSATELITQMKAKIMEQTSHAGDRIDAWMDAQKGSVDAMAISFSYIQEYPSDVFMAQSNAYIDANEQFFDIYVGIPTGEAFFSSGYIPDYTTGWSTVKRPWYIGATQNTAASHITAPYTDVQTGGLCITAARAILHDGQLLGVVGADVLIDYLNEVVEQTRVGEGSYAFIIDGDGGILIHPNDSYGPDAQDNFQYLSAVSGGLYGELWASVASGETSVEQRGDDGANYLFTTSPIPSTGWKIVTAIPTDVVYGPVFMQMTMAAAIALAIILLAAVVLYTNMRRVIIGPVLAMTDAATRLAVGDTGIVLAHNYAGELGILAGSLRQIAQSSQAQALATEQMATGNLTVTIPVRSDVDVIGRALCEMGEQLGRMIAEIEDISTKVAQSSSGVARGAQMLAEGSAEQARTVEEISGSIERIRQMNDTANQTASAAALEGGKIVSIAEEGSNKMNSMMDAVQQIAQASMSVGSAIKVIDDIAFQTNILALNAAVESAHAGEHGKGFAVVAGEVRDLAAKSGAAAKEISELMTANIDKSQTGLSIARETTETLLKIVKGIGDMAGAMSLLAEQSQESQAATTQVSQAIGQVSTVTQQNSAASQQSAAASEEMRQYVEDMRRLVAQFRLSDEQGALQEDDRRFLDA